jgi:hypothetical protein
LNLENESRTISLLISEFLKVLAAQSTIATDEAIYGSISLAEDMDAVMSEVDLQIDEMTQVDDYELPEVDLDRFKDRCFSALAYRLTRKRILQDNIDCLLQLQQLLALPSVS